MSSMKRLQFFLLLVIVTRAENKHLLLLVATFKEDVSLKKTNKKKNQENKRICICNEKKIAQSATYKLYFSLCFNYTYFHCCTSVANYTSVLK